MNLQKLKRQSISDLNLLKNYSFILFTLFAISCQGQNQSNSNIDETTSQSSEPISIKETQVKKHTNGFNSGFLDSDGVLWFGSNGGGVFRYDGMSFTQLTETEGLCHNQVYSIIEDNEGILWFGTQDGLCKYDRRSFSHILIPYQDTSSLWLDKVYPIISPNAVHSLASDKKGNIWIGTGGGGAYRYDGNSYTSFLSEIGTKQEDSLYHNWIPSITEDAEGNIWFASMTHGGASRFDGKNFTHFMPQHGLSDDMVRTCFVDKKGNVWFGFNGNRNSGLTYFNGMDFISFTKEDGLCNTNILGIYEDKNGSVWLGSGRGSLCVFDGTTFTEFTTKEGQAFDLVLFIVSDAMDNIWFGGKHGLWKYDGETVSNML